MPGQLLSKILRVAGNHRKKIIVLVLLVAAFWQMLPEHLFPGKYSTVLVDENHVLLAAQIAEDGQWRFPQLDSVPVKFKKCLLAFEDQYFEYHPGINPVSIFKSLKQNIRSGKVKSGGSTITMQVARMARGNNSRTYYQKVIEMLLSLRIELSYSKPAILNLYCSNAPFGGNTVGLSAASWRYFGRTPEQLSWSESALLAVLPNAPSLIYPGKNQARLLEKRNRLLKKLHDLGTLDDSDYSLALLEPLPQSSFPIPAIAPHLLARCISEHGKGKTYHTTLKVALQTLVGGLVNKHVQSLTANQINNACAIIAETESGRVLAYIGNSFSKTNDHENYVDVIQAPRSTGSILKPFLYAFMLNENKLLPSSLIEDVPIRIGSYGPKNFSQSYDGLVPASEAIARSLNVPAVKMLLEYGTSKFHQRLMQLGFTTFKRPAQHYGLSLILGGGEATLFDVASAYASMGRALKRYSNTRNLYAPNSYRPLTYFNNESTDKKGARLKSDLLSASSIHYTFNAMTELLRPQDYVGWRQFLSKSRIAWKTGTSFGFRDAWAVGLNAKYTVAVWVGNADGEGRPDLTGTAAAAPLMFSIFNVLSEKEWFQTPTTDLCTVSTCKASGFKASEMCDEVVVKNVPAGSEKTRPCPFHRIIHLDESGTRRVTDDCYPVVKMQHKPWFIITPMQEYFYRQKNMSYKPLPDFLAGCQNNLHHQQLEIVYPRDGFRIYIPVNEKSKKSECVLKATHKKPEAKLFWHLDGEYIATTHKYHELPMNPSAGAHSLEVVDEQGETQTCSFIVLSK